MSDEDNLPAKAGDIQSDYDYSRSTYRNLIETGHEALEGMIEVAAESEHPRAYEVLSGMIKNIADITDKLMDLQKKREGLDPTHREEATPQSLTQNNVFVGSTAELQKMLIDGAKDVTPNDSSD